MGSVSFIPASLTVASYGVTTGVSVTYNQTVPASAQISTIGNWGTAEWTDSSKTALTINTVVNNSTSEITGYLRISAYDVQTQSTGVWSAQITVLPQDTWFILTPQRLDFTATGGTMYIDCTYNPSLILSSIQIQNKPSVGSMEFTDDTKSRIAVTLPPNTSESTLSWQPNLLAIVSGGSPKTLRIPITQAPAQEGSITITPTAMTSNWIGTTVRPDIVIDNIITSSLNVYKSADWISNAVINSETNKLEVTYLTNQGSAKSGVVTVSGVDEIGVIRSATFTLNIIAKPIPGYMECDPEEVTIGQSGATANTQMVYTNIDTTTLEYDATVDWLSVDVDENGLVTVTATQDNPSNNSRTGSVYFNATETVWLETASCELVVTQDGNEEAGTSISFSTATAHNVPTNGEVWTENITYTNIDPTSIGFANLPSWLSAIFNEDKTEVTFICGANITEAERSVVLVLSGLSETYGIEYTDQYNVFQPFQAQTIEFPIWKDTDIFIDNQTTNDFLNYRLVKDGGIIFNGTAYRPVATTPFKVRINDILKDYLRSEIDLTSDGWSSQEDAYITTTLLICNGNPDDENAWVIWKYINTYNDWSYVEQTGNYLTEPIYSKVDDRQKFIYSFINYIGENPTTVTINGQQYVVSEDVCNFVLTQPQSDITVDNKTFKVERTDFTHCLYYKNKRGGFSWMLFNRATKQTDKLTWNNYTKKSNNTTLEHSTTTYQTDIEEKWNLKSNYLTDKQSSLFADLAQSNMVWLHCLESDKIIPVTITSTSVEHLGWANNSKHKVRFNIEVANSFTKYNR